MSRVEDSGSPLGMKHIIDALTERFPNLVHGYFNPPREHHEP